MDFLRFFLNHKKLVSFGFLLAFFSSFGQTFLISLYVPGIIREFHLTGASFGTLYGAATILSGLALAYAGQFIDRFSSLALFPYHLVPFLAALCVLILFDHPLAAPVYLTLTGVAMGLSSTIKTALLAEVYGTENLGSIRAMSATVMVFSTVLSPVLFGFLIDRGVDFTIISAGAACVVLAIIIISGRLPYLIRTFDETASSKQLCETPA